MAGRVRLNRGIAAWLALAALLAAGAITGQFLPPGLLDWQPGAAANEPWRAWSAAFVHGSTAHLAVNLAGAVVVGAFGAAARVPPAATLAWLAAWPVGHLALLVQPQLLHYGGLSGVLHAGVAVAAVFVAAGGPGRGAGAAVLAGLAIKILLEAPWGPALRDDATLGIAVAPLAHATGALAGAVAAGAACALGYHRRPGR